MKLSYTEQTWIDLAIVFIFGAFIQFSTYLSWDVSWLMEASNRLLHGGTYAKDFFENNPPMILYLYALPVLLAKGLHISSIITVRVCVFILAFGSLLFCMRILDHLLSEQNQLFKIFFILGLAFCYLILPAYEFGQREHVMLMLVMPYLLLVIGRLQAMKPSLLLSMGAGVMAGIGFAIKPYFLATLVLVELFYLLKRRCPLAWFRVDTVCIAGVIGLYLMSIFWVTPTYLSTILPFVENLYLHSWKASWFVLISNTIFATWVVAMVYVFMLRKYIRRKHFFDVLTIASTGFMVSYLWQRKYWYYHMVPMLAVSMLILLMLLCICLIAHWRDLKSRAMMIHAGVLFLTLLFFPMTIIFKINAHDIKCYFSKQCVTHQLIDAVKKAAKGKTLYVFSAGVAPAARIIAYSGVNNASRFGSFWMLPGMLAMQHDVHLTLQQQHTLNQSVRFLRHAVVEDFKRNKPVFVLVNNTRLKIDLGQMRFDYIQFFSRNAQFKQLWKRYRKVKNLPGFALYERL